MTTQEFDEEARMSVRVYVPMTQSTLAAVVAEGRLAGPFRAHAVTEALVAAWPEGDAEEHAYAAMAAAAEASWQLRGSADPARRIVLAGDVPVATPVVGDDPTLVDVPGDLPWKHVASAHVDAADVTESALEDAELAWFATQEIAGLLDGEGPG